VCVKERSGSVWFCLYRISSSGLIPKIGGTAWESRPVDILAWGHFESIRTRMAASC
jgi:hypothetical protein